MIKQKKKFITFLILLIIFFLGILTERFQIDNKVNIFFKNIYDKTSRSLYSFFTSNELNIYLEPKEYKKIIEIRKKSLEQTKLTKDLEKWSSGKILYEDITRKIQVRLKGVFPDHWSDSEQWSLKVKISNDSKPIKGLYRFALQPPKTTSYIYEWLFMKALEKENLFSLGVDYVDVKMNENNIGVYALIGQISDELIEKNKKIISPIIGFDSELWVLEQIQSNKIYAQGVVKKENGTEDSYYRVKINPIQFSVNDKENSLKNLKSAIKLLESFRQGKLKTSETFDTDQLAKIMALRALLGSSQFDWLDTKFYFNPKTKLLEPISKEIHVDLENNYKVYYPTWWIDSSKPRPDYEMNKDFFIDDIYKDKIFYEKYLKQLNKFSKIKYFENLIDENKDEFNLYLKKIKKNYPTKKIFSHEHLEITRLRIANFLNPIQNLNVYFSTYDDGVLKLKISNLQRIPIILKGLQLIDGSKTLLEKQIFVNGRKPFLPVEIKDIAINCNFKSNCKKTNIENQKLIFQILGQDQDKYASISPFYR
tara:strand:+ start:1312 stop:2919 length:1608 start_codon:yes stop_codon:yes gene_type:complete